MSNNRTFKLLNTILLISPTLKPGYRFRLGCWPVFQFFFLFSCYFVPLCFRGDSFFAKKSLKRKILLNSISFRTFKRSNVQTFHSFNFAIINTGLSVSFKFFNFCKFGGSWEALSGFSSNQSFTS